MTNEYTDAVALKLVEILFRQGVIDAATYQKVMKQNAAIVKAVSQ